MGEGVGWRVTLRLQQTVSRRRLLRQEPQGVALGVQEVTSDLPRVCAENGIEPRRSCSGTFNLRIPPELHEGLAIVAQAEGKSINLVAQETLQKRVAT